MTRLGIMVRILNRYILLFAAIIGNALGNSFQKGYTVPVDNGQQITLGGRRNLPFVISARNDVSVTHLAEIAKVEVDIYVCQPSHQSALDLASLHVEKVQHMAVYAGLDWTVLSNPSSRVNAAVLSAYDRRLVEIETGFAGPEAAATDKKDYCVGSTLSVRVEDLSLLPTLASNLSSSSEYTRVFNVQWMLSDATATATKRGLRRKALDQVIATGADYATAFDITDGLTPVAFEENYIHDSVNRPQHWREDVWHEDERIDWSVPEVEMRMDFKCRFGA